VDSTNFPRVNLMPITTLLKHKIATVAEFCENERVLQDSYLGDEYE